MTPRRLALLAVALLLPAAAEAQSRRDRPSLRVGALVGIERGDLDGLALRGDAEVDLQRLAPRAVLSGVGSLGLSRVSEDFAGYDVDATVLRLVPAARFRLDLSPGIGVYGDVGLGVYLASVETDFVAGADGDDTDVGLMMRFGAGGYLWAADAVRFSFELALAPHFGDYDDTVFSVMFGAMIPIR